MIISHMWVRNLESIYQHTAYDIKHIMVDGAVDRLAHTANDHIWYRQDDGRDMVIYDIPWHDN